MAIPEGLLEGLLRDASARGATAADTVAIDQVSTTVRVRKGEVERVEQAREKALGLRVFFGQRSAVASTSDLTPDGLARLCETTVANARVTAEDPASGLPAPSEVTGEVPDVDLHDAGAEAFDVASAVDRAKRAEATALGYAPEIKQAENTQASFADSVMSFATSLGFSGSYRSTRYGLYTVPIATRNGLMVRDYWSTAGRHLSDLAAPEEVGRRAAERTMQRVGARKVKTANVPVVFDPETASALLGHIAGALNGYSLYKGASFLLGKIDEVIASDLVTIVDDGTLPRGLGSRPFDGEGLPSKRTVLVEQGRLRSYLLDSYSARKLGLETTHNAARPIGDAPSVSPTNLRIVPSTTSARDIIRGVKSGFYVMELIGFGVNQVTGDYSQGAAGMWIEDGELAYPVHEVTIASNLATMLAQVEAIGDDLRTDQRTSSPTLLLSSMTVAGE